MSPKLLILDEPTSWLDPPGQRGLMDLLRTLPQPKLIATHDASFALALTRRAIFLRAGRILADGRLPRSFTASTGAAKSELVFAFGH